MLGRPLKELRLRSLRRGVPGEDQWEMIHQIQILEKQTVTNLGNISKEQETTGIKTVQQVTEV